MEQATPATFRMRFATAIVLSLAFASFLCFSLPVLLYVGNHSEFAAPIDAVVLPMLAPAAIVAALFALFAALLPARAHARLLVLLSALCLLCWVQGTLLVWDYGLFDGRAIDWSVGRWRGWLDGSLWIATLLLVDAQRDRLTHVLPRLAVLACVLQAAIALVALEKEHAHPAPTPVDATVSEFTRFSTRSNVVHILADGMQTGVVADLLDEKHGALAGKLDGFTFYEDNLGAFPYTHMSVPAMLGGRVYDNSEPQDAFLARALGHDSILGAASAAGYEVEVAQPGGGISQVYKHVRDARVFVLPATPHAGWRDVNQERLLLADVELFRLAPHFAKRYVYNDQSWLLQGLFGHSAEPGSFFLAHDAFLRDLAANAKVQGNRPSYKFLHLLLSHRPIVMNADCSYAGWVLEPSRVHVRDQSRCTFRTITTLLARLRQLGVYDNTTIVISGDHGTFLPPRSMPPGSAESERAWQRGLAPGMIGQARPLLLVKPARARGPMRRSMAPTMVADTPATIADAAGIPAHLPGTSALRLAEDEPRERRFTNYDYDQSDWTSAYLAPMQEYLVHGRANRVDSWSFGRKLAPAGKPR